MTRHSDAISDWSLTELKSVYFVGIGGIGMSALARYFKKQGKEVAGYDRTSTPLTDTLVGEGIDIHFEDAVEQIPASFSRTEKENALVVYTPAIPDSSPELNWLKDEGYRVEKRAQVLGQIANSTTCLAIAGTHGKTTTTAIVAHILEDSGRGCNAFIGGITANYHSNVILSASSALTVVEADEFDRSFLALSPDFAVITSVDADHLDIYENHQELVNSFEQFANRLDEGGLLIKNAQVPFSISGNELVYSLEKGDLHADNIRVTDGQYSFDLMMNGELIPGFKLGLPGRHNVENALAAIGLCHHIGVEIDAIKSALANFAGVHRRFDVHLNSPEQVYVDDYAHHPREIDACLGSVREMYPGKKIIAIFQPHLFTRTKDFADDFAKSLSVADEVILLPIYPARELPIAGVDSQMLLDKITNPHKKLVQKSDLFTSLSRGTGSVVVSMGAGDIDQLVSPLINHLS
jgi:UDP-N-acetylmuramate--alanine ligase